MKARKDMCCPTCGAKTVRYAHSLTDGLVRSLLKLYHTDAFNAIHYTELGLSHNELANFQKLRYWGLLMRGAKDAKGLWRMTEVGRLFCRGARAVYQRAVTYRAHHEGWEGQLIYIWDVLPPGDLTPVPYEPRRVAALEIDQNSDGQPPLDFTRNLPA